jgi:hypothetical protein
MSHEMYFQMIITSKLFSALRPKTDMISDFIVNVFMLKKSLFLTETGFTSGPFTTIGLFSRMNSQMMFQVFGRLEGWLTSRPLAQIWSPIVMRSSLMYFQSGYRIETALTLSPIALKRLIARMSNPMILQILVVMSDKMTSIPIALIFNQWMKVNGHYLVGTPIKIRWRLNPIVLNGRSPTMSLTSSSATRSRATPTFSKIP